MAPDGSQKDGQVVALFPSGVAFRDAGGQTQLWPNIVHALSGGEVHADTIERLIQRAEASATLLLQAAESPSSPSDDIVICSTTVSSDVPIGIEQAAPSCHTKHRSMLHADTEWAARHALGPVGAACCQHLSMRAEWACAWLSVQRKLVQATMLRTVLGGANATPAPAPAPRINEVTASPLLPPLLQLWSSLKGTAGLHSRSPEVRLAAVQLMQEALLAQNAAAKTADSLRKETSASETTFETLVVTNLGMATAPVTTASETGEGTSTEALAAAAAAASGGGVSAWTVCRELASGLAPNDTDPRVVAAALRGASALLMLCRDECGAREWKLLAEGVLMAAGRARDVEVWNAAETFFRHQRSHPGWRAAVRHLRATLYAVARESEGPLLATAAVADGESYAVNLCSAAAGAAALEAAAAAAVDGDGGDDAASSPFVPGGFRTELRGNESDAEMEGGSGQMEFLVTLAACLSDAVRHGGWLAVPEPLPGHSPSRQNLSFQPKPSSFSDFGTQQQEQQQQWETRRVVFRDVIAVAAHGSSSGSSSGGAADSAAGLAPTGSADANGDADEDGVLTTHASALAAAAQATCCSLGRLMEPARCLEALEALVARAESAPIALRSATEHADTSENTEEHQHQQCTAPGGPLAVSRAGLLAAAAAVTLGCSTGRINGAINIFATSGTAAAAAGMGTAARRVSGTEGTTSLLAVAVRVVRLMRRVVSLVQKPEKLLFSEVGGAPSKSTAPAIAAAARQYDMALVAGLQVLRTLLGALPSQLVLDMPGMEPSSREGGGGGGGGSGVANGAGAPGAVGGATQERAQEDMANCSTQRTNAGSRRRPPIVIEEVPDGQIMSGGGGDGNSGGSSKSSFLNREALVVSEWRQQQQALVPELVLLCATYAPARPAAAVPQDPGLPPPPAGLFTPWATANSAAAADFVLAALHSRVRPQPPASRALRSSTAAAAAVATGAASLALMPADLVSEQDTLAACMPGLLLEHIRAIVVQRHVQSLEEGPIKPYNGPDTFTRAVAARRLAWLLMRSRHPFTSDNLKTALPALLACCDDPTPGVAQYGVAALHAAATECLAADLQWQRELLLEQARQLVVGCQEQIWPLACPAAVAIVRRIEGKDARAVGYHRLAPDLLTEIERQAHVAVRRLTFMPAFGHLLAGLGLTVLRYTARLMPLLLEWLHAHDEPTRVAALQLLAQLVRTTWPRVAAHAGVLWRHMLVVLLRTSPGMVDGDADVAAPADADADVATMGEEEEGKEGDMKTEEIEAAGAKGVKEPASRGTQPELTQRSGTTNSGKDVGEQDRHGSAQALKCCQRRNRRIAESSEIGPGKAEVGQEAAGAMEVCRLLWACAREEIMAFNVGEAGLQAEAERRHERLLLLLGRLGC